MTDPRPRRQATLPLLPPEHVPLDAQTRAELVRLMAELLLRAARRVGEVRDETR